jgi:hypothetical protein
MIMDGVFASYISRLSDEYTKIETPSSKVKETMLSDATYITEKLSELPGVRKMDQGLIDVVQAREVASPKQRLESPSQNQLENGTKKASKEESKADVLFDASAVETEKEEKEKETKEG